MKNKALQYNSLTDPELVHLMQSNDQQAFAEIYQRYFSSLYIHAYNRIKDKDEAKDLVQELFTQLWSKRNKLDPGVNFSGYLYTWVRNLVLNAIAHQQVEAKYRTLYPQLNGTSETNTDHRVRERQLAAVIEKEIQAMPPKMRTVFQMSRNANMNYKEIAQKLYLSEQSVRSHVKNALRTLKSRLSTLIYPMSGNRRV